MDRVFRRKELEVYRMDSCLEGRNLTLPVEEDHRVVRDDRAAVSAVVLLSRSVGPSSVRVLRSIR